MGTQSEDAAAGPELSPAVAGLADELAALPGAVGVALGGSRATGTHGPDSDWDLGLYYRGTRRPLEPGDLGRLGHPGYVSALGEWGPIMNGGAWLTVSGLAVDVLYRDLDVIEAWSEEAKAGRFEVLTQNGYLAGAPTYLPVGELALCRPLRGALPKPGFPAALAEAADARWRGRAAVCLMFAGAHARAAESVGCAGMLAGAVLCAAHARLAQRREWVLNEKRLVRRAGLEATEALLARPGATRAALQATTSAVAAALGIEPLAAR
jgi:Nucleotidyltransferase domain